MSLNQVDASKTRTQWFRSFMPYCLEKVEFEGHKHVYLPLNRFYKPLGLTRAAGWVDYQQHLPAAMIFGRDPHGFEGVWWDAATLHLYTDATASRLDYFDRLGRLLARRIGTPGI